VDLQDILCPKSDHFSGTTRDNAGTIGIGGTAGASKTEWNARFAGISPTPENPNLNPSLSAQTFQMSLLQLKKKNLILALVVSDGHAEPSAQAQP
jgi:hypothetical protein